MAFADLGLSKSFYLANSFFSGYLHFGMTLSQSHLESDGNSVSKSVKGAKD